MSTQPRTVRRDTRVFISAVTRELESVRKLVKKGLEDNDYHAVEQDNFPPDYRDLKEKLRERIASCDAVVHIAGQCYGAEPKERPAGAPRRSYTQLEYEMAVELGKPVYVFLTGDHFPADPHEPEAAELRELQEAHRRRLTATGRDYNPTEGPEQLDRKIRSLQLKVERLGEELQQVDQQVAVAGGRVARWLLAVVVLGVAALVAVGYVGWRQHVETKVAREEAQRSEQAQQEFAGLLLQILLIHREITTEQARERALKELSQQLNLPLRQLKSKIDPRDAPRDTQESPSPENRARQAVAAGNYDLVFEIADQQKKGGRELALLEGTAALARFRQSPTPEWSARALAAFQRARASSDPTSAVEWKAWSVASISAAAVLQELGRYAAAEPLLDQSLKVLEAKSGPGSQEVARVLDKLALSLKDRNRWEDATSWMNQALAIGNTRIGPDHPDVVSALNNLGALYTVTNKLEEVVALSRRALAAAEGSYGPDHPDVVGYINKLAGLCAATGRLAEAEALYRRALTIDERPLGANYPEVATDLSNLAALYATMNRLEEAVVLSRSALEIDRRTLDENRPKLGRDLSNLARLLQATNRLAEAEALYRRALTIDEQSLGTNHPEVARDLTNLAGLLEATNRLAEAEPLLRRALAISERSYRPDDPYRGGALHNLALLLEATNRLAEAEPLYRRALAIAEGSYGPDHPDVGFVLSNLARVLESTGRTAKAEPLLARAVRVLSRVESLTLPVHPYLRGVLDRYRQILSARGLTQDEISARIKTVQVGTEKLSPIVPEVDRLLGPAKPVADVLTALDRQYQEQGKPAVYFLKPDEPIAQHLDELLGKAPE